MQSLHGTCETGLTIVNQVTYAWYMLLEIFLKQVGNIRDATYIV